MDKKAFALAAGTVWGVLLFAVTILEATRGGAGHTLVLLGTIYPGYAVTMAGSVVGLIYGFVSGAIIGGVFACIYDKLAKPAAGTGK